MLNSQYPQYAVYHTLKITSQSFLFGCTDIDLTWLEKVAPEFAKMIDLQRVEQHLMKSVRFEDLSNAFMFYIVGFFFKHSFVEAEILVLYPTLFFF